MEIFHALSPYFAALLPTVGVAFLFYLIIKYMIEADRSERKALAKWNKEQEKARNDRTDNDVHDDSSHSQK